MSTRSIIHLLTEFEDNSNFVWPENGYVARSRMLRATDPFSGQTNLLSCPRSQSIGVLLYTIIFFNIFLFTLSTHLSIWCLQYPRPSSQRIWKTPRHCDVNITSYWTNDSIAGNRYMNCWPVNRIVLQLIGILLLTIKILCIYCIAFIQEKKWWCITKYNYVDMLIVSTCNWHD